MALYEVTKIEYDFDNIEDGEIITEDYKEHVIDATLRKLWEVECEDDLVDEISDCFGWEIKSIDYHEVESN